jgi:hypothetical protein
MVPSWGHDSRGGGANEEAPEYATSAHKLVRPSVPVDPVLGTYTVNNELVCDTYSMVADRLPLKNMGPLRGARLRGLDLPPPPRKRAVGHGTASRELCALFLSSSELCDGLPRLHHRA